MFCFEKTTERENKILNGVLGQLLWVQRVQNDDALSSYIAVSAISVKTNSAEHC